MGAKKRLLISGGSVTNPHKPPTQYRLSEYPEMVTINVGADNYFMHTMREAIKKFDYNTLYELHRIVLRTMRKSGRITAITQLFDMVKDSPEPSPQDLHIANSFFSHICTTIYNHINPIAQQRFFPTNSFTIEPDITRIVIKCSSLEKITTKYEDLYRPKNKPTITLNSKKHDIVFTKPTIDKLNKRFFGNENTYSSNTYMFEILNNCQQYEQCQIKGDGDRRHQLIPAISLFDQCAPSPPYATHRYITTIQTNTKKEIRLLSTNTSIPTNQHLRRPPLTRRHQRHRINQHLHTLPLKTHPHQILQLPHSNPL